ncbi:MAG TPA: enolase C-terminal domain-like protein [Caulobacteraceae bacterium]|jgi:L-fuconate dehydratase|nr:enolase C-terminal domain-like protein [Caulobacteraceae bacterium]
MARLIGVEALDLRFPTSRELDGSDAMNPDPDYSAAYAIVRDSDGAEGHGFAFTIGRGNQLVVAGIQALAPLVVGVDLDDIVADFGGFWRRLAGESQLRWLGPEKGVVHLALAAVVNAIWDLWAKREGQPVWALAAGLSPEAFVRLVDFRHISDAITPDEAVEIVRRAKAGQVAMLETLRARGYPAYTTSAGWLGYPDEKIRALCRQAVAEGWEAIKIKVGRDLDDDRRRCAIVREEIGARAMMIDANQVWEVGQAVDWVRALAPFEPYWIEEPTHPDDVLGHATIARAVAPVRVASGEHAANRVVFKQLLQANAIEVVQADACRLGGLNEAIAVLLLAAKFGKPVCPHAGGVGLCEINQHVSIIDALCVSGDLEGRRCEHAGHLHEHFAAPIAIDRGRYRLPSTPGLSTEIHAESRARYAFPGGAAWAD